MSTPFQPTHALRTIPTESKDCSVIAVTAATGLPYAQVHAIAKKAGRIDRDGFWSQKILGAMEKEGLLSFTTVSMYDEKKCNTPQYNSGYHTRRQPPYPTLAEVLRKFPSGKLVLETRNHAFAVVDGVVMDNRQKVKARYRIMDVFVVKPPNAATRPLAQSDISAMWERLNRIEEKL